VLEDYGQSYVLFVDYLSVPKMPKQNYTWIGSDNWFWRDRHSIFHDAKLLGWSFGHH